MLATVLATLVVYAPAHGQETGAAQKSESTPNWRSAVSDSVMEGEHGGASALTTVHALPGRVELAFSAPVKFRSAVLRGRAGQPGRFYVDISPASLNPRRGATFNLDTGPVRRVRLSLFRAGTVRVVLDLREKRNFQVTPLMNPYRLVIAPEEAGMAERQSQPATSATATEPVSVVAIQQREEKKEDQTLGISDIVWQPMMHPWSLMTHSSELPNEGTSETDSKFENATLDLTSSSGLQHIFPSLMTSIDTALSAVADVSTEWLWEVACRGDDCLHIAEEPAKVKDVERNQIQMGKAKTLLMEENPKLEGASRQPVRETIRTGGSVMDQIWFGVMTAGVFLSFLAGVGLMLLWNLRKRVAPTEKSDGWEGRMAYLEEAVNRAGVLNNNFFHSLEVSQKRLEALLTQSDVAERNLRRLLHQSAFAGECSAGRGVDSLATAALLLSEGKDVQQVAHTVKLPVAQVRLLQELRACTQEEKPTDSPEKFAIGLRSRNVITTPDGLNSRLGGTTHNGMDLADNGHQL